MNRIVYDMPREEYDTIDAINFSTLKHMRRSAQHYLAAKRGGMKDSDAKKFGRAAHIAILEPDRFSAACIEWTGGRRQGKEWEAFKAEHADKEILTSDEMADCKGLAAAVAAHPTASHLLSEGRPEVVCLWSLELVPGFSVDLKARLDWVSPSAALDLKSVRDARDAAFGRDVAHLDYLAQAAFYGRALEACGEPRPFYFMPGENAAPYCVRVVRVTEEQIAAGWRTCNEWLLKLAWCREMDLWPGYEDGVSDLVLPAWADLSPEPEEECAV